MEVLGQDIEGHTAPDGRVSAVKLESCHSSLGPNSSSITRNRISEEITKSLVHMVSLPANETRGWQHDIIFCSFTLKQFVFVHLQLRLNVCFYQRISFDFQSIDSKVFLLPKLTTVWMRALDSGSESCTLYTHQLPDHLPVTQTQDVNAVFHSLKQTVALNTIQAAMSARGHSEC